MIINKIKIGTTTYDVGVDYDNVDNKPDLVSQLELILNSENYKLKGILKDSTGSTIYTSNEIDLPLESVVINGSYDSQTKEVVLTLVNGSTIRFSVADLVSGLVSQTDLNTALANYYTKNEVNGLLANKQDIVQYSTMPTASESLLGKMVQYTGTTDSTYTNGYFYKVVSDEEETPTYSWEIVQVQESSGGSEYIKGLHYVDVTNANRCVHTYEIYLYNQSADPESLSKYGLASILLPILQDIFSNYIDDFTTNDLVLKMHYSSEEHILKNSSYRLTKNMSQIAFIGLYTKVDSGPNLNNIQYYNFYNLTWVNNELTNVAYSNYFANYKYTSVVTTGNQYISGVKTFTTLPESNVTPTSDNQLTRKGYVDSAIASAITTALESEY